MQSYERAILSNILSFPASHRNTRCLDLHQSHRDHVAGTSSCPTVTRVAGTFPLTFFLLLPTLPARLETGTIDPNSVTLRSRTTGITSTAEIEFVPWENSHPVICVQDTDKPRSAH
uniref:(California timema) hypothetical protein n=1 Tax=Timema californicum TaxID=61474 RepID=A0A7R9JGL8_TIMCA|nr:unnamed protein product [Timema californicum]